MAPSVIPAGNRLYEALLRELPDQNVLRSSAVARAFLRAEKLYGDRTHWTGVPLMEHVIGVVRYLLPFGPDEDAVVSCVLHHALDVHTVTLDQLGKEFGPVVRSLVSGVHLLSHVTTRNKRMSVDNLRLMFLRVSDDIRIVLMILCDEREILDHLPDLSPENRRRACQDVLQLFSPVAARLGMYSLKQQLESFSFPVAYPTDATRISEQLGELKDRCGDFLPKAAKQLEQFLKEEGVDARIEGRQKQNYSIFRKMGEKSITHIDDLYDLFALRVIVPSDTACYQVLGLLHRIGHPVPNRFKDYIAFPKPNGYQSLHTTLAHLPGVPDGIFIEVQIRTEAMHRESEFGIAAHWSYKEGGHALLAARRAQLQKALALQPASQSKASGPSDHIFVLTPKGDVIELPERATPLDFAFQVHSNLGLAFKAARVNGMIVPMRYELENGDVVDILRHSDPKPSPQWLTLLRTATARTRLKRFLAERDRPRLVDLGRVALNRELKSHALPPLDPDLTVLKVFDGKKLSLTEREDILMTLGQGSMKTASILPHIDALRSALAPAQNKKKQVLRPGALPIRLESDIRMPVRFAQCCKPDEGKHGPLVGVVNRGGEVRVHRSDCRMTKNVNPERRMKVRWVAG